MTIADITNSPHYRAAQARRQRILDFLRAHPGARLIDMAAHMAAHGDTYSQIANLVVTMVDWREIRYAGEQRARQYFALAAATRTDAECCAQRNARLAHANEMRRQQKSMQAAATQRTGGNVHQPGDRPLRHQGGQGARREPIYASGAQNY